MTRAAKIVRDARVFAKSEHGAIYQRRKYTGELYSCHLQRVVDLVQLVPHTDQMVAAAWLHDVVEDTPTTLADVHDFVGVEVTELVRQLTHVAKPEDGTRAIRKQIDREHYAMASPAAKTIKLADVIDNARLLVKHDPDFAAVYLPEQSLLIDVLREGDGGLWAMADYVIHTARASLEAP